MIKLTEREESIVEFALRQAELSKCRDKKTAAILVSEDLTQVYSIGINGGPKGGLDCLCNDERNDKKKYTCVHAEINCLVKNRVVDDEPKIMVCTKQPCAMCASAMVNSNANIKQVWYVEEYWDNTGLDILDNAGIEVLQITEVDDDTEIHQV